MPSTIVIHCVHTMRTLAQGWFGRWHDSRTCARKTHAVCLGTASWRRRRRVLCAQAFKQPLSLRGERYPTPWGKVQFNPLLVQLWCQRPYVFKALVFWRRSKWWKPNAYHRHEQGLSVVHVKSLGWPWGQGKEVKQARIHNVIMIIRKVIDSRHQIKFTVEIPASVINMRYGTEN